MHKKPLALLGAMLLGLGMASTSQATTMLRVSLDQMVREHESVVVGEVVALNSHWNKEHSFILTDVTLAVDEVMQGAARAGGQMQFTLMGGTVDGTTNLIVAGPTVSKGQSYLLFLNHESLPGLEQALTVRELSQGIFDLVPTKEGLRAVSQASAHPLFPDTHGNSEAVGGSAGYLLDDMKREINEIARHQLKGNEGGAK